jgi:acyl carrier protein
MSIDRIKAYVQENVVTKGNETPLGEGEGEDWLANGLVDSLGIIKIVSFVEREFKTNVPEEDVTVDNFKSLRDIARYLERRKSAGEA